MLKLFKPYVSKRARWYALQTLSGAQLAEGPRVVEFEHEFEDKFRVHFAVALNSGTTALELAYDLSGIGPGDEVITPVLTCTATNIPLIRRKAKIVFADIDYDLNINIEDVKRKITPHTKAIVFVHFGGNNRGLEEILALAAEKGLIVIEDAAQAVGSQVWGHADFTCVSLQAIKTLTSGDGGFLLCNRREDYLKARRLRWYGYDRQLKQKLGDTDLTEAGYKYHMNDITASIGLGNLRSIDHILEYRRELAEIYEGYGLFAHSWLAGGIGNYEQLKIVGLRGGFEVSQYHFRNDKYSIFKEFKSECPVMDELENKYFFIPYHHDVEFRKAYKIGELCRPYLQKT